MRYFPLNYDVVGRRVLVVGGGKVARRKVRSLVDCGAEVTVVSPVFCASLARMTGIRQIRRTYRRTDLRGACLVISATDSREINRRVCEHANEAGIPVNVVDQPERCTFIVPAVIVRGELVITVATGGASPALAKQVRRDLEAFFGPAYGIQSILLRELRGAVLAANLSEEPRQELFRQMAAPEVRAVIDKEGKAAARRLLRAMLKQAVSEAPGAL